MIALGVICDECGAFYSKPQKSATARVGRSETVMEARFSGWLVMGVKALCPECRRVG